MTGLINEFQKELGQVFCFADKTVENYVSCILMFYEYAQTKLCISPLNAKGNDILNWITSLKARGLSYSRIEHHRSSLKLFFTLLIKLDIIHKNPAEALPFMRKRSISKIQPVPEKTVLRLLNIIEQNAWTGRRNYIIVSMLWALGLRISELTRLTVGSFEPEHDPEHNIGLIRVKGKNRKQRVLFVVDKLYQNLVSYLKESASPKHKNDPLFPVKSGKAISNSRIQKKMKEYCLAAGIKERLTPHVLRHSFATEMYHKGVPVDAIQVMMGHENRSETAVYIKVNNKVQQEALYQLTLKRRLSWE